MRESDDLKTPGITVRMMGGLGNQLFIYAAGRTVAERVNCALYVDLSTYHFPPLGQTARKFEIGHLVEEKYLLRPRRELPRNLLIEKFRRRMPWVPRFSTFREGSFNYDSRIERIRAGTTLTGYFQSWRYFAAIAAQLRVELTATAPSSSWLDSERAFLSGLGGPWMGVHVRRGDYLKMKNQNIHGVLGSSYYRRALAKLDPSKELPLVLFSDDPKSALELIEPLRSVEHVIVSPPNSHSMESCLLMSEAHSFVIANSSFSWWGAWLADPSQIRVVAPDPWFVEPSHQANDLYPEPWIRLASDLRS